VPREYLSREYVIDDYEVYRLRRPPRGHCWIRVDDDFLLTVIATGVIVEIF
jgi:Ni/Co efflux regulator RcnB